jgi:DNA modification methylase
VNGSTGTIPVPRNQILVGDAARELRHLPDASVDMVLTSPPYFRLRDYQVDGQLGLEAHVSEWVSGLRAVADEVARVLVPTGSFWLNVADTYSTHDNQGAARKSLLLAPERLAVVLLTDGWTLRNKIVWAKPNPMPSSVRDRLACTWEALYVFVRQPAYFFDLDSIRAPHKTTARPRRPRIVRSQKREVWRGPNGDDASGLATLHAKGIVGHPLGKNPGDVWQLSTSSFRGAHHATFPIALAERAIRTGCPEARCTDCRSPWKRQTIRTLGQVATRTALSATCACDADSEPGLVLDPFFGAASTGVAAQGLGRDWLGVELNPDFAALGAERLATQRASMATAASESA